MAAAAREVEAKAVVVMEAAVLVVEKAEGERGVVGGAEEKDKVMVVVVRVAVATVEPSEAMEARVVEVVERATGWAAAVRAAAVTSMQDPDVPIASSAARAMWVGEMEGAVRAMLTEAEVRAAEGMEMVRWVVVAWVEAEQEGAALVEEEWAGVAKVLGR